MMRRLLQSLSRLFGYLYVTAWSVSFYPPLILNYRLKSTEGISLDFIALNIVGYISLVLSMSLLLYHQEVRQLYHEKHNFYPLLTNIDLIYSIHGFILTLVTTSQLCLWPGFSKRAIILKRLTKLIILTVLVVCFGSYSIVGTNKLHQYTDHSETTKVFTILDMALLLSYLKILMSLIKYIPQLTHNYKRKSVSGFSILTIFLDLTGGTLSILQLFIDSYLATGSLSYEVLSSNGGKLGLSFVTFFFDTCFIYQWLTYGDKSLKHDQSLTNVEKML